MPDDIRTKVAEVIEMCIESWFCEDCDGAGCTLPNLTCRIDCLLDTRLNELADAVLEAAGHERLQTVVDAAKAYLEHCSVLDCMSDDDPLLCEDVETCYKERLRVALQRAGKEA